MTSPAHIEPAALKDPADDRRRPLMGVSFWAAISFGLLCVLAGAGLAVFGPKLLAQRVMLRIEPGAAPERPVSTLAPTASAPTAFASAPTPPPAPAAPVDVAGLSARLAIVETQQIRTAQAAAAALAAAAVVEASQGSGPFAAQVAGLVAMTPPSPELSALAQLAATGAPSRAALAASFPDYAARAASAARMPGAGAGFGDQITYALSRVVTLRRVGDVPGTRVDAVIARAERQVEDGDLGHALSTLDGLPKSSRDAIAGWRDGARRRAEIDRNAAALRARALHALAASARPDEMRTGT